MLLLASNRFLVEGKALPDGFTQIRGNLTCELSPFLKTLGGPLPRESINLRRANGVVDESDGCELPFSFGKTTNEVIFDFLGIYWNGIDRPF